MSEYIIESKYDTFNGTFSKIKHEEIVRCRDCKRATIDQGDHDHREPLWCSLHRMDVPPDGFCAWGERRY